MRSLIFFVLAAAATTVSPTFAAKGHDHSAHAGEGFYADIHTKVHADNIVSSEESDGEFVEIYTHSHFDVGGSLGEYFSIHAGFKLEGEPAGHAHGSGPALAVPDGSHRFFDDHPLLIEQLRLSFSNGPFSLYAGKFNPIVGFDYERFPGVYSYQTVEEYAIRERIGVGGAMKFNAAERGTHKLDISGFFADTTFLSDSIITRRGQTDEEDGGVSNTEDLSSFAISLGGTDFYSLTNDFVEGLSYRVGYAKQKAGMCEETDERRMSASLEYKHVFSRDLSARLVTEYMDIDHFGGVDAHDRSHGMVALGWDYKQWNLSMSYMHVNNKLRQMDLIEAMHEHHGEEEENEEHDEGHAEDDHADEDEHGHDEESGCVAHGHEDEHGHEEGEEDGHVEMVSAMEEEPHDDEEDHGHGHEDEHDHGGEGLDGHIFQVSVGYRFDNGVGIDWGYQYVDEEGEITERTGLMLSFGYAF